MCDFSKTRKVYFVQPLTYVGITLEFVRHPDFTYFALLLRVVSAVDRT